MSFVKIHGSILDSSIWGESLPTRVVWITMLAMADENGIVEASVGGLARRAVVTIEECREALSAFAGPDPDSRDDSTGERVEKVPGGWMILNHAEYRDKQTRAQVLAAKRSREYRDRQKAGVTRNAISARHELPPSEAEAEAEADSASPVPTEPTKRPAPQAAAGELFGKKPRGKKKPTTAQAELVEWFQTAFTHHRGDTYHAATKDFVAAAGLLAVHSRDEIEYRAETMLMKTSDFWIENSNLNILLSRWNSLIQDEK